MCGVCEFVGLWCVVCGVFPCMCVQVVVVVWALICWLC